MSIPPASFTEYALWLLGRRRLFTIFNESMQPTLKPGDKVFVDPSWQARQSLKPGDIAIAHHPFQPNLKLIKRVQDVFYDGSYYLVSDNASELTAQDSRKFGPVAPNLIIGRVTSFFYRSENKLNLS
ncbi:nickel-type superoxide dismutase maturation protease [Romeria aff. gracilis LEGE 07310]|uniref:Nickel-type superoxide dismutase maturation protease n=1 Tax=Vasconcelosia minhoensis LEGE 07310 TaxID=915328 RepID=A0A8J7AY56_9CYAN|nr:nickel-type superoxide dismutase maturation protease [Romeria gracilis]MBE9078327.1 nickel-type superoxide dismutase maturation protease [Romeria aff. gracilis LEGE 07310]